MGWVGGGVDSDGPTETEEGRTFRRTGSKRVIESVRACNWD